MTQVVNAYVRWPFTRASIHVIQSRDGRSGLPALVLFLRALTSVVSMRRTKREVVVVHLSQGGSFVREGLLLVIARARRFPTVAQLHGSSFVAFAQRRPRLVRAILGRADVVHALSDATAEAVKALVPDAAIRVIPNAVPAGLSKPKENLVVFGGAVTTRKGVDTLLAAWQAVHEHHQEWSLVVAGPHLEPGLVESLPAGASAPGAVPHADLLELLEKSAVAVLPSLDEAMPMFILEALARDNCVVATPVGGIAHLLSDDRGVLVPPGDETSLSHALHSMMSSRSRREDIASRGRAEFDESFSADVIMPLLESMWIELCVDGPSDVITS